MKKLPIIIASLVLSIGAGVGLANSKMLTASAASNQTYVHGFTAKPTTTATSLSGVKWKVTASTSLGSYNSSNYAGFQIGSKSANGSVTMATEYAWGQESGSKYEGYTQIDSVCLWLNLGGSSVTPSVTIGGVEAISDGTKVVKNSTAGNDYTKATKVTFTPSEGGNTGIISFKVDSVNAGYVCGISVSCTDPNGTGGETDSVTFSKTSGSISVGSSFELNAVASGDVTWSTSNSAIATVSGSGDKNATATITGVSAGEATITATVGTASATYTLTVVPGLQHAGTLEDPFSVADIRNAIDGDLLTSGKRYFIKGLFSKYANNGEYSAQYKNSSFFVKDNLSDTEDFEFFHVASSVPVSFEQGDEVIASATTSNFKIYNTTYEFAVGDLYNPIESILAETKTPITTLGTILKASDLNVTIKYKHATVTVSDGTNVQINGGTTVDLDKTDNTIEVKYTNSSMGSNEGTNEATFNLEINGLIAKVVSSIEIQGALDKTSYSTDDEWNLSGLSLKVTYSTSETAIIELDNPDVTIETNPETPTLGTTLLKVSISFGEKTAEQNFAVSVVKARKAVYSEVASYNFVGVSTTLGNGTGLDIASATTLFDSACEFDSNPMTGISVSTVYYGNSSGGAFQKGDMIRLGSGSNRGNLKLTFNGSIKVKKVIISAHDWVGNNGTAESTITVTGDSTGQKASTSGTYTDLTFTIANPSNIVEIITSKRVYINKISILADVTYEEDTLALFEFIDNYMHMDDISKDNHEDTGACAGATGYYALASAAYNNLSDTAKRLFCTNEAFTSECARFIAWANANGQTIDTNNNLVAASKISSAFEINATQTIVVLVSISCVSILGAILIIKKRKHH